MMALRSPFISVQNHEEKSRVVVFFFFFGMCTWLPKGPLESPTGDFGKTHGRILR